MEKVMAQSKPVRKAYPPRVGNANPNMQAPIPRTPVPVVVINPETKKIFDDGYDRCTIDLPFNPNWSNGTGLFDYAVYGEHAPTIPIGQMARSATPSGRKLIIIGTRLGNVVVFERQVVGKKETTQTYCYQSTSNVTQGGWFFDMKLDEIEMELAVGDGDGFNIGRRIDALWTSMKKTT